MGEEKLVALIQNSLATATRTGAAKPSDFSRVIVDTTVQSKRWRSRPTPGSCTGRGSVWSRLAKKTGVSLRQSYARVGKHALIAHRRCAHAKQFKRANRALRTIRTYLGRVCRDLVHQANDDDPLRAFAQPLSLAFAVREQRQHRRGRKIYSLHAPRSNASARARRIDLTSSASRSRSPPRFIAQRAASSSPMWKAMPGNPYDGHTLAGPSCPTIEAQIGTAARL